MKIDEQALSQYDFLKDLPWLNIELFNNSIYSYLLSVASFLVIWVLLHILRRYVLVRLDGVAAQSKADIVGFFRQLLGHLSPGIFPLVALFLASRRLEMAPLVERGTKFVVLVAVTMQVAVIASELVGFLIFRSRIVAERPDDPAVRNTNQNLAILAKVAVWTGGILFLLDNLGFNVSTFIAGLGIGGIAIALATQAILGDTFSSFAIALDKPFEVGDFIVVDNLQGSVEHVGLKTTRIRSAGGELLIFANSDLTKSRIKNFKRMYERRVSFKINVAPSTARAKLPRIVELLKAAVTEQAGTRLERAHFAAFSDDALVYDVSYFVMKPDYNSYMDVQQAVNFKICEAFEAESVQMWFK